MKVRRLLLLLSIFLIPLVWLGVWLTSEAIWHLRTKPRLLLQLETDCRPELVLETRILKPEQRWGEAAVFDGVRIRWDDDVAISALSQQLVGGDGFNLRIHVLVPEMQPQEYFARAFTALTVKRSDIEQAATSTQRKKLEDLLALRAFLMDTYDMRFAYCFEGPTSKVLCWNLRDKFLAGIVTDHDFSGRRDFRLEPYGLDEETAWSIVAQLEFIGASSSSPPFPPGDR